MAGTTFGGTKYSGAMGVVGGLLPMAGPVFGLFGGGGPSLSEIKNLVEENIEIAKKIKN